MTINLRGMSADDLQKLLADAQAALDAQAKIGKLRADVTALIEAEGLTVADVFPQTSAPEAVRRGRKPKEAVDAGSGFVSIRGRKPVGAAKYAHPENPADTWTGKGRKPLWVIDHITKGGTLDDLLIK